MTVDLIALAGVIALAVGGGLILFVPGMNAHVREVLAALTAFAGVNAVLRTLVLLDIISNTAGRQLAGLSAVVFAVIALTVVARAYRVYRIHYEIRNGA